MRKLTILKLVQKRNATISKSRKRERIVIFEVQKKTSNLGSKEVQASISKRFLCKIKIPNISEIWNLTHKWKFETDNKTFQIFLIFSVIFEELFFSTSTQMIVFFEYDSYFLYFEIRWIFQNLLIPEKIRFLLTTFEG